MGNTLDWLTTQQAAEEIGVNRRRIQALIDGGRLHAIKVGRDWLVSKSDLELVREKPVIRRRLTEQEITEIRDRHRQGESVESLARCFGVTTMTIYRHLK